MTSRIQARLIENRDKKDKRSGTCQGPGKRYDDMRHVFWLCFRDLPSGLPDKVHHRQHSADIDNLAVIYRILIAELVDQNDEKVAAKDSHCRDGRGFRFHNRGALVIGEFEKLGFKLFLPKICECNDLAHADQRERGQSVPAPAPSPAAYGITDQRGIGRHD